jgi:hypothetical protein
MTLTTAGLFLRQPSSNTLLITTTGFILRPRRASMTRVWPLDDDHRDMSELEQDPAVVLSVVPTGVEVAPRVVAVAAVEVCGTGSRGSRSRILDVS